MRVVLCALLVVALSSAYLTGAGVVVTDAAARLERFVHPVLYERTIEVEGASLLSRDEVIAALPREKSNAWWRTHLLQVPEQLLQSPLVGSASVSPCSEVSLTCFRVTLTERRPAFIAVMPDERKAWIVGDDGAFIAPVTHAQFQKGILRAFGKEAQKLVVVRGLWGSNASPDVIKNRLLWVVQALRVLRSGSGLLIHEAQLTEGSELRVRFEQVPYPVVFEFTPEALAELEEKGRQLRRLTVELRGETRPVKEIDFALRKMAVVRY